MKRIFAIALTMILALSASALASADGYWTSNDDFYYHAVKNCGGIDGRVPISLDGAAEFEKYPCPVCIPVEDDGSEPTAAARGDVIVLRFSDEWLTKQELTDVFGFMDGEIYEGAEAERERAELLHGEAYTNFPLDGTKVRALQPRVLRSDDEGEMCTILSERHVGSAWYVILLPTKGFGASWEMYWYVSAESVWMEDGALHTEFEQQTLEEHRRLGLELLHGSEPEYSREGEPKIRVYAVLDTHIAVIYEANPDENFLEDVELRIGENSCGPMQGRMQDDLAVYYCALTDGELAALRSGAQAKLWHEPDNAKADYMGGPYAAVYYGESNKMGIVDRDGNYVVEPEYDSIDRRSADETRATAPTPFFCNHRNGGSVILDGETLEVLFESARNTCYGNPAVFREMENTFAFWMGDPCTFRSMADGSVLFEYAGQDACGWWPDDDYKVLADGEPARMVAVQSDGASTRMWLIDNRGKAIPDTEYQRVTALCWKGECGIFLTEKFDPDEYEGVGFGENQSYYDLQAGAYDGRACYGPHWRCGLIDQDGKALAELKYVEIQYLSDGAFQLTGENGEVETVKIS